MRAPDLVIGPADNPYMLRWHIFRWRGWQLALHKICRSDDDRALHDHSGDNLSFILAGWYLEHTRKRCSSRCGRPHCEAVMRYHGPLSFIFRKAETPHRLELVDKLPVWTLWLRWPPRREWGFHCPKGWRSWRVYLDGDYRDKKQSTVGRGCD